MLGQGSPRRRQQSRYAIVHGSRLECLKSSLTADYTAGCQEFLVKDLLANLLFKLAMHGLMTVGMVFQNKGTYNPTTCKIAPNSHVGNLPHY